MFTFAIDYPTSSRNEPRYTDRSPNRHIEAALAANRETYRRHLQSFAKHFSKLAAIDAHPAAEGDAPAYVNGFLPGLDCVALYCLIAELKPRLYIEVGSGNSTKFARRSISDHQLDTRIVSIDPAPRREIDRLCDKVIRSAVEDIDLALFEQLQANDIAFIDNSHRCFMNSDVTVCFLDIMPRLAAGAYLQLHDVFWPYDYPADWASRFYNEQYVLGALLANGCPAFEIEFPACYLARDAETNGMMEPLWQSRPDFAAVERHGGSFWMRKNGAPDR
jgi:cephalosporin hydroxylase